MWFLCIGNVIIQIYAYVLVSGNLFNLNFSHPFLECQVSRIGCHRLFLSSHSQPFSAPTARHPFIRSRWRAATWASQPGPRAWVPTPLCVSETHGPEQTSAATSATPTTGRRGVPGLGTHGSSRLWVIWYSLYSDCYSPCNGILLCVYKNFN